MLGEDDLAMRHGIEVTQINPKLDLTAVFFLHRLITMDIVKDRVVAFNSISSLVTPGISQITII